MVAGWLLLLKQMQALRLAGQDDTAVANAVRSRQAVSLEQLLVFGVRKQRYRGLSDSTIAARLTEATNMCFEEQFIEQLSQAHGITGNRPEQARVDKLLWHLNRSELADTRYASAVIAVHPHMRWSLSASTFWDTLYVKNLLAVYNAIRAGARGETEIIRKSSVFRSELHAYTKYDFIGFGSALTAKAQARLPPLIPTVQESAEDKEKKKLFKRLPKHVGRKKIARLVASSLETDGVQSSLLYDYLTVPVREAMRKPYWGVGKECNRLLHELAYAIGTGELPQAMGDKAFRTAVAVAARRPKAGGLNQHHRVYQVHFDAIANKRELSYDDISKQTNVPKRIVQRMIKDSGEPLYVRQKRVIRLPVSENLEKLEKGVNNESTQALVAYKAYRYFRFGGRSIEKLAERTEGGAMRVVGSCKAYGVPIPADIVPFGWQPDVDARIAQGMELADIARETGKHSGNIATYIKRSLQEGVYAVATAEKGKQEQAKKRAERRRERKAQIEQEEAVLREHEETIGVLNFAYDTLLEKTKKNRAWAYAVALHRAEEAHGALQHTYDTMRLYVRSVDGKRPMPEAEIARRQSIPKEKLRQMLRFLNLEPPMRRSSERHEVSDGQREAARILFEAGVSLKDTTYFVNELFGKANHRNAYSKIAKDAGIIIPPAVDLGHQFLTRRLASQVYEIEDMFAGESIVNEDIRVLTEGDIDAIAVARARRETITPVITGPLSRVVGQCITTPYLNGHRHASVAATSK